MKACLNPLRNALAYGCQNKRTPIEVATARLDWKWAFQT